MNNYLVVFVKKNEQDEKVETKDYFTKDELNKLKKEKGVEIKRIFKELKIDEA